MPIKKVFLSSTARDLKEYREAAYRAIEGLDDCHCVRMEDFGARDDSSEDFCRSKVEECDLFVGIIGHLYGSCPDGCEKSYTELEYDAAVGAEIPRLIFVANDAVSLPPSLRESDEIYEKHQDFRKRVDTERIRDSFESPQDLSGKIRQAIHNWEREQNNRSVQKRAARVPFQAPPLPEHFIPRPEKSEEVKRRLLTNISDRPGVLVVSALHGLGGIGKTVLASSLAHDDGVRDHFPDGILWATLGQEPDLLSLLSGWIQALGDYEFHPTTPEAASMHLSTLLHDKTALLVVDDAWNSAHVQPFREGGPHCSLLITTRDSLIAEAVGVRVYDLDVMTEGQSLALLSKRLGRELVETERQEALDLAKEVGYLPLALNLIAAQIEDGVSWAELLEELRAEIARLEALEKPGVEELDEATRRNLSLRASFRLSIQSLPEKKRVAFAWLGVLPEDVLLSPNMATTLWDVDLRSARDTLRYLRNKALLQPGPKIGDVQTYRLHDLLHYFARNLMVAPIEPSEEDGLPGLGFELRNAHASLLKRYREKTINGQWHTLPDDGYIHNYIFWNMRKAAWFEDIDKLLLEETVEGKNAWYMICEKIRGISNFLDDVSHAWNLAEARAENEIAKNNLALILGCEIRYSLITASINSILNNIPPDLMIALVENNLWTPEQVFGYARQMPNPARRAETLLNIAAYLQKPIKDTAIDLGMVAIQDIRDPIFDFRREQSLILAKLAIHLPETMKEQILERALNSIFISEYDWGYACEIAELILSLSKSQKERILKSEMEDVSYRTVAAIILSSHSDEQLIDEALMTIKQTVGYYGVILLVSIAPYIPEPNLDKALNIAIGFSDESYQADALAGLAPYLSESQLRRILKYINKFEYDGSKDVALASLSLRLGELGYSNEALIELVSINNSYLKAKTMAKLASYMPTSEREVLLKFALEITRAIQEKDIEHQLYYFGVTPTLEMDIKDGSNQEISFAEVLNINDEDLLSEELHRLAPNLSISQVRQALKTTLKIEDVDCWDMAMNGLASRLAELGYPEEALATMRERDEFYSPVVALDVLTPYLSQTSLEDVLSEAYKIVDEEDHDCFDWTSAMAEVAERWAELGYLDKALQVAQEIRNDYWKSRAMIWLAPYLEEPTRIEVLVESLEIAQKISITWYRTSMLRELATQLAGLPLERLHSIWRENLHIMANRTRSELIEDLSALTPVILALGGEEALLETARAIQDVGRWWP